MCNIGPCKNKTLEVYVMLCMSEFRKVMKSENEFALVLKIKHFSPNSKKLSSFAQFNMNSHL